MQVATTNSVISSSVGAAMGAPSNATNNSNNNNNNSGSPASLAAAAGIQIDPTLTQIIIDHPLYPLLQMVFQKCELATSSPRDAQAETICSSESFGDDIRNFINEARHRNVALRTGADDVDQFMLKAIEVLRIHLLELEKVHQLCDNFCQRYINCLKGKLPIDLVVDDGSSRDTNSTSRNGTGQHPEPAGAPSNTTTTTTTNNNNNNNNQTNSSSHNGQSGGGGGEQHSSSNNNGHTAATTTTTTNHHHHHHHHNHHHQQQQLQPHSNHHSSNNSNNNSSSSDTNNHHHHSQEPLGANGYAHEAAAAYQQSYVSYTPASYGAQSAYAAAAHQAAYAAGSAAAAAAAASMPHYQAGGGELHHSAAGLKHDGGSAAAHLQQRAELTGSSGSSSASSVKLELGAQFGQDTSGATTAPDRHHLHDDARSPAGSTGDASLASGDGTEEDEDNRARRQQKKRGIFPKAATNIMRAWLFQHLNHPYPSEDQKKQLAEETGLTILQVNNWFINARRRIVQPMIDQSNRTSGNIMAGPAYSPDAGTMGYMLGAAAAAGDGPQPFGQAPGGPAAAMNPLASHAAMTSAMGAYSAASAQHLSQYNRQQQQHAAMLGLPTPPAGSHMMGHPTLPPHDYY